MHLAELAAKLVSSLEALLTQLVEPVIVATSREAVSIRALIVAFDEVSGWV